MKITNSQYAKTLLELTDGKSEQEISGVVEKFSEQLKKDGQLKNAGKIIEKFSDLYNASHGIVEAIVVSSRKLSGDQIHEVGNFVKEKYSAKKVEIENVVDEKIKGGLIIKVRDEVVDGSVENKLNKLKNVLSK